MTIDPATLREMAAALPDEERDEMAIPSYLHKNPALRWMAWRRVHVVGARLRALCPPGGALLDFGCGAGVQLEAACAVANTVYGVDLVLGPARLWVERKALGKVRLMGPEGLAGLPDGCLDLVVAAEVLEHIDDLGPVLADFRRLLKPGGRLLVSLPTEGRFYRLGRRLAGFDGHFHVHNAASIDATIQAAGWAPTERAHIPAPGPLAIYLVAAYAPAPA